MFMVTQLDLSHRSMALHLMSACPDGQRPMTSVHAERYGKAVKGIFGGQGVEVPKRISLSGMKGQVQVLHRICCATRKPRRTRWWRRIPPGVLP